MPKKSTARDSAAPHRPDVSLPAEAALSFLKETKGVVSWKTSDVVKSLKITRATAEKVVALLEAQGYVQSSDDGWMTTSAREAVSGAKPPRYTRESVEQAVEALKQRLRDASKDFKTPFKITQAVAFGDFLLHDRTRVQAAEVGIGVAPKDQTVNPNSVPIANMERDFLRQLRGKTALLNVVPFADWMSQRSHIELL